MKTRKHSLFLNRTFQYFGIILLLATAGGGYWYWKNAQAGVHPNAGQEGTLSNGLVGYWPFDGNDISGTTAYDRSGNANNGTLMNGPTVTPGRSGQALNFDGNNDFVSISDIAFGGTNPISICSWVKPNSLDSRGILTQGTEVVMRTDGTGHLEWILNGFSTNDRAISKQILLVNGWSLVCGTYVSGGDIVAYVNGIEDGRATPTGTYTDVSSAFVVGDCVSCGENFNGAIDEPRIYNRALSASEIWDLYQMGNPDHVNSADSQGDPLEKGLVGYWKLDDASGTSATDSSGNANTGTLTNGPTWTTGQIGGATNFDGTDDYVVASHNAVLNAYPITVSGWIQTSTVDGGSASRGIIGKYRSGSADGYLIYLYQGGVRAWYFRDPSNNVYTGTSGLGMDGGFVSDGNWHNVTLTIDATGGKFYVDGVKKASLAWTGTPGPMTTTQPFCVGIFSTTADCTAGTLFNGKIDEVRT